MKHAKMKITIIAFFCILALLIAVFLTGRYGWKLGGFNACETAGIEQVNVEEDHVRIRGFYPGSFPRGFLGYHAEQVDHTLYVGFKFSALFGIFETGDFDITIPTTGTVTQVVVKSGDHEYTVWPQEDEFYVSETEATENGICVRFADIGSSGADSSYVTTLKLEGEDLVDMTYTTDPADYVQMELTPLAQWTE